MKHLRTFNVQFGNGRSLFVVASSAERAPRLAEQFARDSFVQPTTIASMDVVRDRSGAPGAPSEHRKKSRSRGPAERKH